MTVSLVPGSFRDPSGFCFLRDGLLYRQVNRVHAEHYDRFMRGGLYDALVDEGLLVTHEQVGIDQAAAPDAHAVLLPERVPFVSYPYEWCPGQLRDAALATLRIQQLALDHGMTLRDASAYNIQFHRGRPVLIDTLSFEVLREGEPWTAYRQFCEHFLAPLALVCYRDVRLAQLARIHVDGVALDLAAKLLPARTKARPGLGVHIHQHARSQRRHAAAAVSREGLKGGFSLRAFRGLVENLASAVRALDWQPQRSAWVDYYDSDSYSREAMAHKREVVDATVRAAAPRTVWDLGANTGEFSLLAARAGATVVALESDPSSVEAAYRHVVEHGVEQVLPLVMDLTNPSPGLGWAHTERQSLAERGPADLVLALGENVRETQTGRSR